MGLFKKPVVQIDNDDEMIRREIRARVARQVGIHDEEYINTGKMGGNKTATPALSEAGDDDLLSVPDDLIDTEALEEPVTEQTVEEPVPVDLGVELEVPLAEQPQEVSEEPDEPVNEIPSEASGEEVGAEAPIIELEAESKKKSSKRSKKKNRNLALIFLILVLVISFVPLYYYLTNGGDNAPKITTVDVEADLLLTEPLVVRGMVSDIDNNEKGIRVYYSIDNGSKLLFYTFKTGPGLFESEIDLPDTSDFVGTHSISIYAKDTKGKQSAPVTMEITVGEPKTTAE